MQVILVKYPTRVHCTTSTVLHCTALHNELKSEGLPVSDSATSARASQHHQQIYFLLAKIIWNIHPSHILPIFTSFLPKSFHCHTCPWPYLASIYISLSHNLKINFLSWLPFSYHFHLIPLSILSNKLPKIIPEPYQHRPTSPSLESKPNSSASDPTVSSLPEQKPQDDKNLGHVQVSTSYHSGLQN